MAPTAGIPVKNLPVLSERTASREVESARRMIEDGEYHGVIPRLQYLMVKYPNSAASLEARYLLGVSYTRISGYHDALVMYREYLELAPDGPRAEEVRQLAGELTREYQALYPSAEQMEAQIQEARDRFLAMPESPERAAELAELLWLRGNYEEAGAMYAQLAANYPNRARELGALDRIELYSDNTYVVLTPTEVNRRHLELNPLEIINLNAFRAVRDSFSAVPRFYVVTGQAVNRSDSVLYNVEVQVTIYGFGNVVYDTNIARLGRLYPDERRAFSIRFTNFEDINRIDRYEAEGRFER